MVERGREVVAGLAEHPPVEAEELAEATALLEWILDDHFTFLGYHVYDLVRTNGEDALRRVPGTGFGILRDSDPDPGIVRLGPEAQELAREDHPRPDEGELRATVHRPRTSTTSVSSASTRRARSWASAASWALRRRPTAPGRTRSAAAPQGPQGAGTVGPPQGSRRQGAHRDPRDYPRDELFQISEELFEIAMGILHLGERLFLRRDRFGRFLSCLVFVPRPL